VSDRPTIPSPPPIHIPMDPPSLHQEGLRSPQIRRAHEQLTHWFLESTRVALGALVDREAGQLRAILLENGLDLYTQGSEYTRRVDRWVIEAYLSCLGSRIALPSVRAEDLSRVLGAPEGPTTIEEITQLCRALGLPLDENPK